MELVSPSTRQWAQSCVPRIAAGLDGAPRPASRDRRCLIVHLDGVPKRLLDEMVSTGGMPFFSRLIQSGQHHLDSAFWGTPASTPAFQAGLLYGLRTPNLPAYNWYDRQLGREVKMSTPRDTLAIEERLGLATRGSLLEGGGTSYLSLFRAQASNVFCMSGLADKERLLREVPKAFRGLSWVARRGAWAYLRSTLFDLWETARDVRAWVRRIHDWRFERQYLLNRFLLSSPGWQLACARATIDMVAGVPAIYLVYGSYDEVSHRRGPFSEQARQELLRVDSMLEELYAVAQTVERPYDMYLLTDHGHVDSSPFEQRRGTTLSDWLLGGPPTPIHPDVERGLLDGRPYPSGSPALVEAEPKVVDAGNFSHVYLSRGERPLEALELLTRHREVLARATSQNDIGVVALRRGDSAVAVIAGGVYGPDDVDGAPLSTTFSKRAVADLLRELPAMSNAGDLVLYGQAVSGTGTVGFAWEFGSHGSLTRIETESVICWPKDAPLDLGGLSHSVQLHQKLSEVYRN